MTGSFFAPLERRLLVLVGIALLPAVILGVSGFIFLTQQQHAQAERASVEIARAMMSAVDKELQLSVATAQILALSRNLDGGDLRNFHDEVHRLLIGHPSWETILLLDTSGRQVINARMPFDAPLAGVVERDSYDQVLRDQRPVVGNVARGPGGRMLFPVRSPVLRGGKLRYVLSIAVNPESLLPLILRQKIPADGVITVFDNRGNIVARSRRHTELVGTSISPGLRELASHGREGWGTNTTLDGERTYSAFARSEISQWGIGVGLPRAALDRPLEYTYFLFGAGACLSLALGALAAAFVARRISIPILELGTAAESVGRGEIPAISKSSIPEVHRVGEALAAAARARARAEQASAEHLERERHARAVAEDANRMKDEFLAMLGHELRNPLAAISNAVHILDKRGTQDETARSAQQVLARQVNHLARLMDDLLDVGRVMTGKIVLDRLPVNLAEAVQLSLSNLCAAGRLEQHDIATDLAPAWINADRNRVEQVIVNLVINAVKYTPASAAIAISVKREGDHAILQVRDQGIGMEQELVPHIFNLFVQGKQALDRAQGGLGIGLTLVRRLVELHGGSIAANSEGPGKGSSFTARFPAISAPERVPAVAPRDSAHQHRRVLIVEDSDDARTMMRILLEIDGHTVQEARDGPAGLDAIVHNSFDMVLIDIGLPGLDGYAVAKRIRTLEGGKTLPLVAVTGYGQPEDRRRAFESGFDMHLTKPVSVESLRAVLAAQLPNQPGNRR